MSILNKYWISQFIKFFFIVQVIVLCIFVSVDYLTNMERFLKAGYPLIKAFGYVLLKVPQMFTLLTPVGTVLAIIVVFGLMNRNNELLALKGSGINAYLLVKPAAVAGVVLSVMMFFLGETLVPATMAKANHIKYTKIKKIRNVFASREDIWIRGDRRIAHFKYYNPVDKTLAGVSLTFFDDNFNLKTRVDAAFGKYESGMWHFARVLEQNFLKGFGEPEIQSHDIKAFSLDILPEDLERVAKKSDEMSFTDLSAYIRKVESEGYDATLYRVDLYGKTAFPFICLIMAITGATAGMRSFVKESLPLGIALGLVVSFCYWVMYGFCTSLGYGRMLPPFISAWAANFFFFLLSVLYCIIHDD